MGDSLIELTQLSGTSRNAVQKLSKTGIVGTVNSWFRYGYGRLKEPTELWENGTGGLHRAQIYQAWAVPG